MEKQYTLQINQDEINAIMQLIDAGLKHSGAALTGAAYTWQTKLFEVTQKHKDNGNQTELSKMGEQPADG